MVDTSVPPAPPSIKADVPNLSGQVINIPIEIGTPLFVVGPNGSGKSGLVQELYTRNWESAVRISAHRQNWMESNALPFSPQDRLNRENAIRSQDQQPTARWKEWGPESRVGIILANLIDSENAMGRNVRERLVSGDDKGAKEAANKPSPLENINLLLSESGIPVHLSIAADSSIVAAKRGGVPYSIAALSDGERSAILTSGTVLTAGPGSFLLIDEPERHMHDSIVRPLLTQLFQMRSDCAFLVATHDLLLPVHYPNSRTVIVRDSCVREASVSAWDLDILPEDTEIDDTTRIAILGARRRVVFVEGRASSLDTPLYEILFPKVSISPQESCGAVERCVDGVRASAGLHWVEAFGIVDQDQLTAQKKASLLAKSIFALNVYSVEGLYYHPAIQRRVADRQVAVLGGSAEVLIRAAADAFIPAVDTQKTRLAARMTEQVVKDMISLQVPDWKAIASNAAISISVDAKSAMTTELTRLETLLAARDVSSIVARYPVRETGALGAIAANLGFKSCALYESAVRKLVEDDPDAKAEMLSLFGPLSPALLA